MDGISTARHLRREGYSDVYILGLTAYSFNSHRQECEAAWMYDFLSKPLPFADPRSGLAPGPPFIGILLAEAR